jgi:hypothetical protein
VTLGLEVDALAGPNAAIILPKARRGLFPAGATRDEVSAVFSGWRVVDEKPYQAKLPPPLRGIKPKWYRLARV